MGDSSPGAFASFRKGLEKGTWHTAGLGRARAVEDGP